MGDNDAIAVFHRVILKHAGRGNALLSCAAWNVTFANLEAFVSGCTELLKVAGMDAYSVMTAPRKVREAYNQLDLDGVLDMYTKPLHGGHKFPFSCIPLMRQTLIGIWPRMEEVMQLQVCERLDRSVMRALDAERLAKKTRRRPSSSRIDAVLAPGAVAVAQPPDADVHVPLDDSCPAELKARVGTLEKENQRLRRLLQNSQRYKRWWRRKARQLSATA